MPSKPICAFLHYFKFSCLRKQPTLCIATIATGSTLAFGSETSSAARKIWLFSQAINITTLSLFSVSSELTIEALSYGGQVYLSSFFLYLF